MTRDGLLSCEYDAEARRLRGAWLRLILFLLASALLAAVLFFLTAIPAKAVGPHGPFGATTEKCEKCHAMHTASSSTKLLVNLNTPALCQSCHSGGVGADTAVMQGTYMQPATSGGTDYVAAGTLLAGGFNAVGGTGNTSSTHPIETAAAPLGAGNMGATISLTCTSCHTPHEGPNYRLLRRGVGDSGTDFAVSWNGPYPQPDGTLDYAFDEHDMDLATPGVQYFTYNYSSGMSAWCSGCHSKYMTRQDSTPYEAGDAEGAQVRFRHAVDLPVITTLPDQFNGKLYDLTTDLPLQDVNGNGRDGADTITCLTCHRAHGTNSTMDAGLDAQAGTRGSLPTDSMLLRLNDRQICQTACHKVVN